MTKKIMLFVLLLLSAINTNAQTPFEVPKNIKLDVAADYSKYEKDIVEAAKWLEQTDLDKETDKRKEVDSFIIQWVSGSPTVTVEVSKSLSDIYGKNEELLILYLASYSRNCIELKQESNKQTATKAGILSIMTVYKKGIKIKKSKEMEKVIQLEKENKLEDYILEKF